MKTVHAQPDEGTRSTLQQVRPPPAVVPDQRDVQPRLQRLQHMASSSPTAMQLRCYAAVMAGQPVQRRIAVTDDALDYADAEEACTALKDRFPDVPLGALRNILEKIDAEETTFATFSELQRRVKDLAEKELYATPELWIKSGGLEDLKDDMDGEFELWGVLSNDLAECSSAHKEKVVENGGLLDCGKMCIPVGRNLEEGDFFGGMDFVTPDLRLRVGKFLMGFMKGNGQLGYVQEQDWFIDGSCQVVVEMNFYPDREFNVNNPFLGVHKDTDSRNLFVNLVFNNETDMPNTEWTMDEFDPDQQRKEELDTYLPQGAIRSIMGAKEKMQGLPPDTPGKSNWEGGTVKRYGYASWVDELIWHSTPSILPRRRYQLDAVLRCVTEDPGDFAFAFYEAMLIVAENTHGNLADYGDFLKDKALVDMDTWEGVAANIRTNTSSEYIALREEIKREINAIDWNSHKMTGGAGSVEKNLGTGVITDSRTVPSNVGGRPRSNSTNQKTREVNDDAILAMRGGDRHAPIPKRSFIRSWVTLVKND